MRWVAELENGEKVFENDGVDFLSLNTNDVSKFHLVDDLDKFVPFDSSTGTFRFNDLDIRKFDEIADGQKFILEFDKTTGTFKFTKSSFKNFQEILLDRDLVYKLGFDSVGNINVGEQKLVLGIKDDMLYTFNSNRISRLIQYKDGYSDIKMLGNVPVSKVDRTSCFNIGYESDYRINDINYEVKVLLSYNLVAQAIQLSYTITSDKDINLKIYMKYGESEREIPVELTSHSPMQTKRVLDLLK